MLHERFSEMDKPAFGPKVAAEARMEDGDRLVRLSFSSELPVLRDYPMHRAPRCSAKSKRTGLACNSPAVRGWAVCRMHGAQGGARPGRAHPNYRHGGRSGEAMALRRLVNTLGRDARKLADALD